MVALNTNNRTDRPDGDPGDLKGATAAAIAKILQSEIRLYSPTSEFLESSIPRIAAAAFGVTSDPKSEQISFKIRACVSPEEAAEAVNHTPIEVYRDGEYLGAAWLQFESGTLAGAEISPADIEIVRCILRTGSYEIAEGKKT